MCTLLLKRVHCGIFVWCMMGYVRWFYFPLSVIFFWTDHNTACLLDITWPMPPHLSSNIMVPVMTPRWSDLIRTKSMQLNGCEHWILWARDPGSLFEIQLLIMLPNTSAFMPTFFELGDRIRSKYIMQSVPWLPMFIFRFAMNYRNLNVEHFNLRVPYVIQ